jgi:hypothetical protein
MANGKEVVLQKEFKTVMTTTVVGLVVPIIAHVGYKPPGKTDKIVHQNGSQCS